MYNLLIEGARYRLVGDNELSSAIKLASREPQGPVLLTREAVHPLNFLPSLHFPYCSNSEFVAGNVNYWEHILQQRSVLTPLQSFIKQ